MDKPTSAFETSGHVTPPTEEKVHVAAESEEIHSKTLDSGTRLPYNTGHGDFSFGRINNGHNYRSINCPLPRVPLESPYMSRDKFERYSIFFKTKRCNTNSILGTANFHSSSCHTNSAS